jgi:hypothetical protein
MLTTTSVKILLVTSSGHSRLDDPVPVGEDNRLYAITEAQFREDPHGRAGPVIPSSVAVPRHRRFGLAIGVTSTRPLVPEGAVAWTPKRRVGVVQHTKPRRLESTAIVELRTGQHRKRRRANDETSTLTTEALVGGAFVRNVEDIGRAGTPQRGKINADRTMPTEFVDRRFGHVKPRKSHALRLTNPHRHHCRTTVVHRETPGSL